VVAGIKTLQKKKRRRTLLAEDQWIDHLCMVVVNWSTVDARKAVATCLRMMWDMDDRRFEEKNRARSMSVKGEPES